MWKRKCPLCFVRIPWTATLAHSYEIICPACYTPLELSRFTRILGAFGGIAGGFVAFHFSQEFHHGRFWLLPIVAAIFGYGGASVLFVLIAGDLVVRTKEISAGFPHASK